MSNSDSALELRKQRGLQIATATLRKIKAAREGLYVVPSQAHTGTYLVDLTQGTCTCRDFEDRHLPCKHIFAVEWSRSQQPLPGVGLVEKSRITYPQNWTAYNKAQTVEKDMFQLLLRGLCDGITQPPYKGNGRPRLSLADVVYAATMKVYSTFSGRRAMSDIRACKDKGYVSHAAHYNTVFEYLQDPTLTDLLKTLITESALPLRAVEHKFGVDSTGFTTATYHRWFDHKYGKEKAEVDWIKLHVTCGLSTNIITSIEITEGRASDGETMMAAVKPTLERFNVTDLCADAAYSSKPNLEKVYELTSGKATLYTPFRRGTGGRGGPEAWNRLWHLFEYRKPEFLAHYRKRANVETTMSILKRKFGPNLRSKNFTSQSNELAIKCLCANLVTLVHEMHELGIEPKFWLPENDQ